MKTVSFDPETEAVIVLKKDPKEMYIAGNKNHPMTIIAGGFFFMGKINPGLQTIIAMYIQHNREIIHEMLCEHERIEWTFSKPKTIDLTCQ